MGHPSSSERWNFPPQANRRLEWATRAAGGEAAGNFDEAGIAFEGGCRLQRGKDLRGRPERGSGTAAEIEHGAEFLGS